MQRPIKAASLLPYNSQALKTFTHVSLSVKEKLERADAEFRKFGGEAYQEKSQYEHIIAAAKNELAQQEKKAEDFAAGLLPFALLRSDVQELIRQA